MQNILEQANQAIGRLDGRASVLPDLSLFLYTYARKEVVLSSQIEGTQSSLSDLLIFENDGVPGAPLADVLEVSNYVAAMNHGLARQPAGPCGLRAAATGAGSGVHGQPRTIPARRLAWPAAADQSGVDPRPIRNDPSLSGRQRPSRAAAHHLPAVRAARRIVAMFDQHQQQIEALGRPAASVLRVFQHLQRNPLVSIPATVRKIGVSAPTVAKSMQHLLQLGILREVTGRERHRLFVYEAYLAILNEGTEPL